MKVLTVFNEIGFMDDFVAVIKDGTPSNAEDKLETARTIAIECPDSNFGLTALPEMTKDGVAKEFTFSTAQSDEGAIMTYLGMTDGA
ncbi:hypothetical protein [Pediococcus inopinatus]|uniref:hypothetical protein n=1 Tax=Pediococcus inopinatus TaxID=114090 RepID=UPI00070D7B1A|nr:hypothetical protein [Pediococcus inopinatus]AVK99530.1 hypothetical protein PI20285_02055 [Pediococcus inopinatus]KRN63735.1 hypothetical protein IV83_GL000029 [Pediococcus inopinatus]